MNITDGKRENVPAYGPGFDLAARRDRMRRIYDRLRKRSYRRNPLPLYRTVHRAYLRGVRDALNEVLDG